MKKMLLFAGLSFLATLCLVFAQKKTAPAASDIDLTRFNTTMMYSQLFNMLVEPERYEGKTVRMHGTFSVLEYEENGALYRTFACIVTDASACCAQGMEFSLKDGATYPHDYPPNGTGITIRGMYHRHEKDGYDCIELVDTVIEH